MADDITRSDGAPARHLTLINAGGPDQNFGLLVRPGTIEVVPDTGAPQVLAWRVALVPGRSGLVSSRRGLAWVERHALVLGRFDRGRFAAEAVLPLAATGEGFRVGFVGTPENGAAKLLDDGAGAEGAALLSTDGSFPSALRRTGTTRDLAAAVAIDPTEDLAGAALAVPLASNMAMTLARRPAYSVAPLPLAARHGSVVPPDLLAAAHPLDFGDRDAITLLFTDRNAFEEVR